MPTSRPIALALAALAPLGLAPPVPGAPTTDQPWWAEAVFYQVFVRSFADSTEGPLAGDGVGDLRGLIERLDTLNDGDPHNDHDLGVTALWLLPLCESPSYHGYDVTDYRRVNPEYGTREDFLALIDAAHERGVRIIVDNVINHTSSEHPWFREAIDPESPRHAWYVWSPEPRPAHWGRPVWHDRAGNGLHYFGLFWHGMPDLNLRSPDATRAVHEFSRYWLTEMRADGFRLDAVKHLVEDFPVVENTPESIEWLADYRSAMKAARPDAFLVGEVWADTATVARYVPDALDAAFEFDLASAIVEGVRDGDARRIARTIEAVSEAYPPGRFATFLANHDMPRVMTTLRAGSDNPAEAQAKARLCATIQLTLPGVPFIYYGEEIGMSGDKPDPDIRTPMQWTGDPETAGFTTGRPWRAPNPDTPRVNRQAQAQDPDSLLSTYRRLIALRQDHPGIARATPEILQTDAESVLAYAIALPTRTLVVAANISGEALGAFHLSSRAGRDLGRFSLPAWGVEVRGLDAAALGPADDFR
jgi:alpha-amylase